MKLKQRHLFEFMDLDWLPQTLRLTMREALEAAMSAPFRDYYDWVAAESLRIAKERGCDTIVELGAGTAPLTRRLAVNPGLGKIGLVVCDLNPDFDTYSALEAEYPGKVTPNYEPMDFSRPNEFGPRCLLVLSATFHHLPKETRKETLRTLTASSAQVLIFEPLRRTLASVFYAALIFTPTLFSPLIVLKQHGLAREGHFRRMFWCWALPLAPFFLAWDGIISCLRMWTADEWAHELATLGGIGVVDPTLVQEKGHTQVIDCAPALKARVKSKSKRAA
jgi:hypothetical protein